MNKILEGVFVQTVENKKVVTKYVPLWQVPYEDKKTLKEYINKLESRVKSQEDTLEKTNKELSDTRKVIFSQSEEIINLRQAILELNNKIEREGEIV